MRHTRGRIFRSCPWQMIWFRRFLLKNTHLSVVTAKMPQKQGTVVEFVFSSAKAQRSVFSIRYDKILGKEAMTGLSRFFSAERRNKSLKLLCHLKLQRS